jgi:5-methylcytosine-specific restriction endonuclease McrA
VTNTYSGDVDMSILPFKRCGGCKTWKTKTEFHKNRTNKDGLSGFCKACAKASHDRWMERNPGKHNEFVARYHAKNPEKARESGKRYAERHPDKIKAKQKKRLENKLADFRRYRWLRRARIKGNGGNITLQEWENLKAFYNYTCLCCGKRDPEIKLSLDHVLPLAMGGANTIENCQPLCVKCNNKKGTKHIDYRPGN